MSAVGWGSKADLEAEIESIEGDLQLQEAATLELLGAIRNIRNLHTLDPVTPRCRQGCPTWPCLTRQATEGYLIEESQ